MRFLGEIIMRGRMAAIAVAATTLLLSLILPPLSLVAAAAVALVTLRMGFREGLNTLVASTLAAGLLGATVLGNFMLPAMYGLMLWLPTWGIALVLRQSRDLGLTLEVATIAGVIGTLLFFVLHPDPTAFWYQRLELVLKPLWENAGIAMDPAKMEAQLTLIARYLTGVMAAGMVSSLALSILLARWWQSQLFNPGGFREEFLRLKLHRPLVYITVAFVVLAFLVQGKFSDTVNNTLIVLAIPYVVAGTAILHAIFVSRGQRALLIGMYVLMFFIPHIFLPIAVVGLADAWVDWRARFVLA